jgi:multiple sugar transport system substrate-binding protein
MKRRQLGASIGATLVAYPLFGRPAWAQDKPSALTVLGHRVHQSVSTGENAGTTGGDVTEAWRKGNGVQINWVTADVTPIHDRLMREMTLGTGNIDLAFFLNRFVSPKVFDLLQPLDEFQAKDPIEDIDGLSKGMRDGMTYKGKLYGIPFRQATNGLIYNETLLQQAGFSGPPATFRELIEMAKKLYRKDAAGNEIFGLTQESGSSPMFLLNLALANGKQFLQPDYKLNADTPEYIATLTQLKDLYDHGGLVKNFTSMTLDAILADMQNGRAAMTINPFGRLAALNDPKLSRYPGKIKAVAAPLGADGTVPAQTEVWYLVIPGNSPHKQLAWSLIKALSSPDATVREALNGNGPTRPAAFKDPRIVAASPSAAAEAASVASAHLAFPGFDRAQQAQDAMSEESDAVLLGRQSPEQAAKNTQRRVQLLLPK